jgi:hypothetical protein
MTNVVVSDSRARSIDLMLFEWIWCLLSQAIFSGVMEVFVRGRFRRRVAVGV